MSAEDSVALDVLREKRAAAAEAVEVCRESQELTKLAFALVIEGILSLAIGDIEAAIKGAALKMHEYGRVQ